MRLVTLAPMYAARSESARMRSVAKASPPTPVFGTPGVEPVPVPPPVPVPVEAVMVIAPAVAPVPVGVILAPLTVAGIEAGTMESVTVLPTGEATETLHTSARRNVEFADTTAGTRRLKVEPAGPSVAEDESGMPSASVFWIEQFVTFAGGTPLKVAVIGIAETATFCPPEGVVNSTVASATFSDPAGTDGAVESDAVIPLVVETVCAAAMPALRRSAVAISALVTYRDVFI